MVLGLIAGPGYFFYCSSSGSPVEKVTVFSQDVNELKVGNATLRSETHAKWNSPITLKLTPEMNPLSLNATVQYLQPTTGGIKRAPYRVAFKKEGETLWEKQFSASAQANKKKPIAVNNVLLPQSSISITFFSVEAPGFYTLQIQQNGKPNLAVSNLDLEIRRNVILPNMKIVLSGALFIILSIFGFIFSGKKKDDAQAPRS